jgi:hypothetical protein
MRSGGMLQTGSQKESKCRMPERKLINNAVTQAFQARKFVLNALLKPLHDSSRQLADKALFFSVDGWRLFLRVERCAWPLSQFLEETGFETVLPDDFRDILRAEADWEWQRIASAKRQLHAVGAWALGNECRPIVLKGGLSVIGNAPLDLNDLDILLPRSDGDRLFNALIEDGYHPPGGAGRFTRDEVWRDGALAIEIHDRIHEGPVYPADKTWPGAREIPACPGLWRLAPADHLWHVLIHNVGKHPERRGRIRDLLLLRSAIDACSPDDIAAVKRVAVGHVLTGELNKTLTCVLGSSDSPANNDPLEETALLAYLLAVRKENRARVYPTSGMVSLWVYALLSGPIERRDMWAPVLARPKGLSSRGAIRYLQLTVPRLARVVQVCGRFTYRAAYLVAGYVLAIRIRRLRARYLRYFREQDQCSHTRLSYVAD